MGSDTFLPFSFKEEKRVSHFLSPVASHKSPVNKQTTLPLSSLSACASANEPSSPAYRTLLRDHQYEHLKRFNPLVAMHGHTVPPLSSSAPFMSSLTLSQPTDSKSRSYLETTNRTPWITFIPLPNKTFPLGIKSLTPFVSKWGWLPPKIKLFNALSDPPTQIWSRQGYTCLLCPGKYGLNL